MRVIKLTDAKAVVFDKGIVLDEAYNVKVTREINGANTLEFSYPLCKKAEYITNNKIVVCEGQAYRIMKAVTVRSERLSLEVMCSHVYNADAPNIHIQNIPDMIGVNPYEVLEAAFAGTRFSFISDGELEKMGMRRVDYDGFMIDFFSADKTNPYDVMLSLIENCGKGEIYADNYKIALVERIGKKTNIRLDISKNLRGISVERDITDMVTRLYPYGKDDAHIGSVNSGEQYIESANAEVYGVREGYRDYSDYMEPDKIMRRALWEFDSANPERIDVPCVNITGTFVDIAKLSRYAEAEKVNLGDSVTVMDGANEICERVIKIEYYPYQPDSTVISIGRVKKDLFFYLDQIGTLARRYGKVSTSSGKVKAQSVAGVISNSGIRVKSDTGALAILSDLLKISTGNIPKVQLGNQNGRFVCKIMDNSGHAAIDIDSSGTMQFTGDVNTQKIKMGDNVLFVNSDGELCINGKAIMIKESE